MTEYVCELEDARYEMDWTPKEEIVRCRDCEHGLWNGKTCDRLDPCFDEHWFDVEPNGFCAWAKRKEGGDEA